MFFSTVLLSEFGLLVFLVNGDCRKTKRRVSDDDECGRRPCSTGRCVDRIGGFMCECPPGRTGKLCNLSAYKTRLGHNKKSFTFMNNHCNVKCADTGSGKSRETKKIPLWDNKTCVVQNQRQAAPESSDPPFGTELLGSI